MSWLFIFYTFTAYPIYNHRADSLSRQAEIWKQSFSEQWSIFPDHVWVLDALLIIKTPDYFPLSGATLVRTMHLWVEQQTWACGLYLWKTFQIYSVSDKQLILLLFGVVYLISPLTSEEKNQQPQNCWKWVQLKTFNNFSCTKPWKNHTKPQKPGTFSSCWSHTAVGWHPIHRHKCPYVSKQVY